MWGKYEVHFFMLWKKFNRNLQERISMELTCEIKKKIVKVKSVQCRQHHMAQNL